MIFRLFGLSTFPLIFLILLDLLKSTLSPYTYIYIYIYICIYNYEIQKERRIDAKKRTNSLTRFKM